MKPSFITRKFVTFLPFAIALACARPSAFADSKTAPEYMTIMWVSASAYKQPAKIPLFFQRLREMGVNTVSLEHGATPDKVAENHFAFYVENIVNRGLCLKFSSKVTHWEEFVSDWNRNGRPETAFVRDYSLDDPKWRQWARREITDEIRLVKNHHPQLYDLRDELSTTISANPFDYDFGPLTLDHFREWLRSEYPTLERLNAEWETQFKDWAEVKPFSTDTIKNRMASGEALPHGLPDWQALRNVKLDPANAGATRWNFSPWADFRTYMDLSLARALRDLRDTARDADPTTPVGIEGTQMPSAWGGYDLWRLAQAVDWVEPYDIANAREIFGSFMPGRPVLTTVFEKQTNPAMRRLWHLLLEGDRGCIVWWSEDSIDWTSANYNLTGKALALQPVLKEMQSPVARLFLRAQRLYDPIAIHYSQPSIQVDWLLESTVDGPSWYRRFSSFEADHNRMAKVRNSWLKSFQDLGFSPRFLSTEQIAKQGIQAKVLVLPQSLALSQPEVEKMQLFLQSGGMIFADGTPGIFDEHSKGRRQRVLDRTQFPAAQSEEESVAVSSKTETKKGDIARYEKARVAPQPQFEWPQWISKQLTSLQPEVEVPLAARVRVHRFTLGAARLLAFERNADYHMSEDLKQAGGNQALESSITIEARLHQPAHVYDLRTSSYLGRTAQIKMRLDPWQPSLFALLPTKASGHIIDALSPQ